MFSLKPYLQTQNPQDQNTHLPSKFLGQLLDFPICVEVVDNAADDNELGFVGPMDKPKGESSDVNKVEGDWEAGGEGFVGAANVSWLGSHGCFF